MEQIKPDKKSLARTLYVVEGKSQKEIALAVGVSERTVYTWIHQYAWQKLKLAALQAPLAICDNLSSQLVEMQNNIAAREPGKRFPTQQEADITRKLITSIEAVKKNQSLAHNMQMMEAFRDFVRPLNGMFSKQLAHYANKFLNARDRNGYAPYQVEYGSEKLAAIAPFYDELDGDNPAGYPQPYSPVCTDYDHCQNPKDCRGPLCFKDHHLYIDDKNPITDTPWAPQPAPMSPVVPVFSQKPEILI
jgi:transposase